MPNPIDRTGQKFHRLTALRLDNRVGRRRWICICDCGGSVSVDASALAGEAVRSCGCLQRERTSAANRRHGHTVDGAVSNSYSSWRSARGRCLNPRNGSFADYGARGITMCQTWAESFAAFLADMGPCPEGMTIDRIDNDRGYEPGNCRWATRSEQARNKRTVRTFTRSGRKLTIGQLATALGVKRDALYRRVRMGERPEDAAAKIKANLSRPGRGRPSA